MADKIDPEILEAMKNSIMTEAQLKAGFGGKAFEGGKDVKGFGGKGMKAEDQTKKNSRLESGVASGEIGRLAKELAEQNKIAQDQKSEKEREKLLMDLVLATEKGDAEGERNALELRATYIETQARLERAIEAGDTSLIELEKSNLDRVMAGAETEENRREANKMAEKQSGILEKISGGIKGLTGFLKDNAVAIGGGLLAGLALFAPELMQDLVKRFTEVLGKGVEIITSLLEGDFEGALEAFKSEWKAFTGAFILFFGGKIIKLLVGTFKTFKDLIKAVRTYRLFLATQYSGSMIAHFADMMKNLGSKLMKPINFVLRMARIFRTFMMATFIPGMIAAFSGMIAAITPMLAALAPILLPILAIAAVFGLIYLALEKMREAMGFTSIFDVMLLGIAYLKDAFAHVVNLIGTIVNFIMGLVGKFASFLGFDIDIPKIPKMDTDNASRKKAELQEKARNEQEQEAKKANQDIDADPLTYEVDVTEPELSVNTGRRGRGRSRRRVRKPDNDTGDNLAADSSANVALQEQAGNKAPTTNIITQKGGDVTTNTTNNSSRSYRRRRGWRSSDLSTATAQ
jgi:hypothetical protein